MFHFFTFTICKIRIQHTNVLLLIKTIFWKQIYMFFVFSFLEILSRHSLNVTFSSCSKRAVTCRSQGSCWPLWPQCHLRAEENNNPHHSLCTGFCLSQQEHVHSSKQVPFSPILSDLLGSFVCICTSWLPGKEHVTTTVLLFQRGKMNWQCLYFTYCITQNIHSRSDICLTFKQPGHVRCRVADSLLPWDQNMCFTAEHMTRTTWKILFKRHWHPVCCARQFLCCSLNSLAFLPTVSTGSL